MKMQRPIHVSVSLVMYGLVVDDIIAIRIREYMVRPTTVQTNKQFVMNC